MASESVAGTKVDVVLPERRKRQRMEMIKAAVIILMSSPAVLCFIFLCSNDFLKSLGVTSRRR